MRLAVLTTILGCWSLALWASPSVRRSQILAWSVASIPLGLFLFSSTNPSSWATAGLAALLPAVLALFVATTRRAFVLGLLSLTAALVLILSSRADASAMAAVFLVWCALILTRSRRQVPAALVCLAGGMIGVATFLSTGQSEALSGSLTGEEPNRSIALLWSNALDVPSLWAGALGSHWALGWLDTGMPGVVWVGSMLIVGGLLLVAVERLSVLKLLMVAPVLGMLFFLPWYTLMQSAAPVGQFFQPRYILPLVFLFLGVMLAPLDTKDLRLSRTQQVIGTGVCTMAASVALHVQLRRYTTGLDLASPNLDAVIEWWRLPVITPLGAWALGTIAGGVLFGIAFWLNGRRESDPRAHPEGLPPAEPAIVGSTVGLTRPNAPGPTSTPGGGESRTPVSPAPL